MKFKTASFHKAIMAGLVGASLTLPLAQADSVIETEQKLLAGLSSIQAMQMDKALAQFSELGETHPKYKLAQLVKAELLAAKAGDMALLAQIRKRHNSSVQKLLDEAEVRWNFASLPTATPLEFEDIVMKSAKQKHIMLVSLKNSRLYLFSRNKQGKLELEADYYVTMGRKGSGKQKEGDLRTPIGVYHLVDLLPGDELPDLYGVGALPLNYPNEWDKHNGKTGSGIWLHGVPSDTYIRPPRASRGCVVVNNNAMATLLGKYDLPFSTPVVIADEGPKVMLESKQTLLTSIQAWLSDKHANVAWEDVSVYRYPNETDLFYITFIDKKSQSLVHQFWKKELSGQWTVQAEGKNVLSKDTVLAER